MGNQEETIQPNRGMALSLKLVIGIAAGGVVLIAATVARQPNLSLPREDRERLSRLGQALLQYVEGNDGVYPFSLKPVIAADDRVVKEGWNRSVLDETATGWANEYRNAKVRLKLPDMHEYPRATTYFDSVLDFEDIQGLEKYALRTKRPQCVREKQEGFAVMPSRCDWGSPFPMTCDGTFWRLNFDGSVDRGKIRRHFESKGLLKDLESQTYSFDHLAFFTDACPMEDFMPKR